MQVYKKDKLVQRVYKLTLLHKSVLMEESVKIFSLVDKSYNAFTLYTANFARLFIFNNSFC